MSDERKAAEKAKAVLDTLTPTTPRSDFDVHWVRFAEGVAADAGRTYAAMVLGALRTEMERHAVTQISIDFARSLPSIIGLAS
jgi:hypothetical protein